MNSGYVQTVNLLLGIAPTVFETPRFAMKGGTALNLFVQDLPRLSVDIDVVFINHQADRDNALKEIAQELLGNFFQGPRATAHRESNRNNGL
jgi:predicted nucleotidyltransferase component of viral defense system